MIEDVRAVFLWFYLKFISMYRGTLWHLKCELLSERPSQRWHMSILMWIGIGRAQNYSVLPNHQENALLCMNFGQISHQTVPPEKMFCRTWALTFAERLFAHVQGPWNMIPKHAAWPAAAHRAAPCRLLQPSSSWERNTTRTHSCWRQRRRWPPRWASVQSPSRCFCLGCARVGQRCGRIFITYNL